MSLSKLVSHSSMSGERPKPGKAEKGPKTAISIIFDLQPHGNRA